MQESALSKLLIKLKEIALNDIIGLFQFFFKGVGVVEKVGVEMEMKEFEYEQLAKTLEMFGNNIAFAYKHYIFLFFLFFCLFFKC